MVRLLLVGVVLLVVLGGGYWVFKLQKTNNPPEITLSQALSKVGDKTAPDSSYDKKIGVLETSLVDLAKQVVALNGSKSSHDQKISDLEKKVGALETQVSRSNTTRSTPTVSQTPSTQGKVPIYIPLGSGGPIGDRNFFSVDGSDVSIDPADYPGLSNMQLEVSIKLSESAAGAASARVYNVSDSSGVSGSEVSTSSSSYSMQTSSGFKLPAGKKTYRLQLKSSEGFDSYAQNARIKVNF